jgi:hypothetical protein
VVLTSESFASAINFDTFLPCSFVDGAAVGSLDADVQATYQGCVSNSMMVRNLSVAVVVLAHTLSSASLLESWIQYAGSTGRRGSLGDEGRQGRGSLGDEGRQGQKERKGEQEGEERLERLEIGAESECEREG